MTIPESRVQSFGICDLESEISELKTKAESISKQVGAWMRSCATQS